MGERWNTALCLGANLIPQGGCCPQGLGVDGPQAAIFPAPLAWRQGGCGLFQHPVPGSAACFLPLYVISPHYLLCESKVTRFAQPII